jgi:N-acetylmuramoyl-L-alanine amidase
MKRMGKILGVVIHHTAGSIKSTMQSTEQDQENRGYGNLAYHYYVDVDPDTGRGHLKAGRSIEYQGCHGNNWHNAHWLGFVVEGNYSVDNMSESLYSDVLGALLHVMTKNKIPWNMIKGHREIKATACPGDKFPLAKLKADVRERLKVKK